VSVPTARRSQARDRLLLTASEIFYREGIHDIGVDHILARADVTRSTFYRHFPSKEDLVLAYVEAADAAVRSAVAQVQTSRPGPAELIRSLTGAHISQICAPGFRGCLFINAAAEYPDPDSPVRRAVLAHREWLRSTVEDALRQAGQDRPEAGGHRFMMLRDGAMVAGYLDDPVAAQETLREGVEALLE
jgi:AcrR family transcriptional regulator